MNVSQAAQATLDFLRGRKNSYKYTFSLTNPAAVEVLEDLTKFCRGCESAAVPGDHDRTLILLGRQEVFLRIQQHLNLTPEQLFKLYTGKELQ